MMVDVSKSQTRQLRHPNPEEAHIVADWFLETECNFRCHYCWFDRRWDISKGAPRQSGELILRRWQQFFEIAGRAHITLTGGEPTLHPEFFSIIEGLVEKHSVGVCTNLSRPTEFWRRFADRIKPECCVIDASCHPQFVPTNVFLERVETLVSSGFYLKVVGVAYPPLMDTLRSIAEGTRALGAHFRVQPFNGNYGGKRYPESYSEEEKQFIRDLNEKNSSLYKGLDEDIRIQTEYFFHDKKVRNRSCWAGVKFISVMQDGQIHRCNVVSTEILGNLYSGEFHLLDRPKTCDQETCCCEWKWIVDERKDYLRRKDIPKDVDERTAR